MPEPDHEGPPAPDREAYLADEAHDEFMAARARVRDGEAIEDVAEDLTLLTEADLREGLEGETDG